MGSGSSVKEQGYIIWPKSHPPCLSIPPDFLERSYNNYSFWLVTSWEAFVYSCLWEVSLESPMGGEAQLGEQGWIFKSSQSLLGSSHLNFWKISMFWRTTLVTQNQLKIMRLQWHFEEGTPVVLVRTLQLLAKNSCWSSLRLKQPQ